MSKIVAIVEGPGEVGSLLNLLHRLLDEMGISDIQVARPKNVNGRGNLTKEGGLEAFLELAYRERDCGAVLVLVDADDDCPVTLAKEFVLRIIKYGARVPVVVVCANRAYEAWLIAGVPAIQTRARQRGRTDKVQNTPELDSDQLKGLKGKLDAYFAPESTYKETVDQESLTRELDLTLLASKSRSFRRFLNAVTEAVSAIRTSDKRVTPIFETPARVIVNEPTKSTKRRK